MGDSSRKNKKICACGCGKELHIVRPRPERKNAYCMGHGLRGRKRPEHGPKVSGSNNPNWIGGRTIERGYAYLSGHWEHPRNHKGCVREHVYVMEQFLSKSIGYKVYIGLGLHVHHKNENRLDNRIENLQLMTELEHAEHHYPNIVRTVFNGRFEKYKKKETNEHSNTKANLVQLHMLRDRCQRGRIK